MNQHNPYEGWGAGASGGRPSSNRAAGGGSYSQGATSPYANGATRQSGASPYAGAGAQRGSGAAWGSDRARSNAGARGAAGTNAGVPQRSAASQQQDFEQMCRSIEESVTQMAKAVGRGIGSAGDAIGQAVGEYQRAYRETKAATGSQDAQRQQQALMKTRYRSSTGLHASGVAMTSIGGVLTVTFAASALFCLIGLPLGVPAAPVLAGAGICAVFAGLSGWLLGAGVSRLQTSRRFKAFQRVFGTREVCSFSELAAQLHISEAKALSSARKMLKRGLLPQGHIDDEQTCLMVTDEVYRLYRQLQESRRQQALEQQAQAQAQQRAQKEAARKAAEARAAVSALPVEAQMFIDQGNSYLTQLRDLDVRIDDAAVSAKIVAIEDVVSRIIKRVEGEPSVIDGMGRLMDYYLPTTVKLLEAYEDLEDQPVQGGNIAGSRRDIEQTLDVLHAAFEKLLDESYQDLSMDVSSDISVLNAILAQEGLTDSPFDKRKKAK